MTRRIVLPLVAIALVVAACSVPRDANARVVTNPQNSTPVTVTTSNVDAPRTQAKVYFVRSSDKKLEGVMMSVKKPAMAYELLEALILDGPQERRLESKIPKTVSFEVRPSPEPNELIVILPNFDVSNVNRGTLILAFQQIVYTLTELPNVNSVQFSVNNRLYPVPLKNGDKPAGQGVRRVPDYDQETIYTTTTTTLPPATTAPATTAPASSAPTSAPPGASAPTSAPAASSR